MYRLADYFAGQASAAAKEAAGNPLVPLHHAALPPYQLAQSLGFISEQGIASHVPAFVLTECPAPAPPELHTLLQLHPHYKFISLDHIGSAVASSHCFIVGYKPTIDASGGRYYAVGNAMAAAPSPASSVWQLPLGDRHQWGALRADETAV